MLEDHKGFSSVISCSGLVRWLETTKEIAGLSGKPWANSNDLMQALCRITTVIIMTNTSLLDPFTQQSAAESANCHLNVVEKVTQRLGVFISIFLTKTKAGHFMRKMLKSHV